MTRLAFVDMLGGASGDMLLGAWLDAGLDPAALEAALRGVVPDGWTLAISRVTRRGIAATRAAIVVPGEDGAPGPQHAHRHLHDVLAIIERSTLAPRVRDHAVRVYQRLAQAEAHVHGAHVEQVHFHEVGAIDAVLDVAATCFALEALGIEELAVSPFPTGHGRIAMEHGSYPNPGPATLELLRGFSLRAVDTPSEMVTTTGAALLATLGTPTSGIPDMTVESIGYGAGMRDGATPNVVRVVIGTAVSVNGSSSIADVVCVVETNIDDMSPQAYELACERIFAAGAVDVWLTPISMKKGRPATLLSAIAPPAAEAAVANAFLRETSTIGVRIRREQRRIASRGMTSVVTPYGPVRFKTSIIDGHERRRAEYDDLAAIARREGRPFAEIELLANTIAGENPA